MNAEGTCGLFHCPIEEAKELLPSIPWSDAPLLDSVEYIVDVKVHKLMPEQWPCIPNWHCDFVPRDPATLIEHPEWLDDDEYEQMFMWLSGPPLTEFRDGRVVTPQTWLSFTQRDEHRGVASTAHLWRTFVRIAPIEIVRDGLPHEVIPAPANQWIRRHSQVYLDVNKFKW